MHVGLFLALAYRFGLGVLVLGGWGTWVAAEDLVLVVLELARLFCLLDAVFVEHALLLVGNDVWVKVAGDNLLDLGTDLLGVRGAGEGGGLTESMLDRKSSRPSWSKFALIF
jgi:hypothetical protein